MFSKLIVLFLQVEKYQCMLCSYLYLPLNLCLPSVCLLRKSKSSFEHIYHPDLGSSHLPGTDWSGLGPGKPREFFFQKVRHFLRITRLVQTSVPGKVKRQDASLLSWPQRLAGSLHLGLWGPLWTPSQDWEPTTLLTRRKRPSGQIKSKIQLYDACNKH